MLVMTDNSSSGLRHLKENHKIDKDGQRQASQTRVDAAFAAAATVANLVTRFRASTFRYLLIRWIVTMHIVTELSPSQLGASVEFSAIPHDAQPCRLAIEVYRDL